MPLIHGSDFNDVIWGGDGPRFDFINGHKGDDWINVRRGDARVHAGAGNDTMIAGQGARVEFFGGEGNDIFDVSKAGVAMIWTGTDPGVGHSPEPSSPWDVDVIRFGSNRGQIANLEGSKDGETVIMHGVWENRHHIVVPGTPFGVDLEQARFVPFGDGYYLKRAVLDADGGPTIVMNFAAPDARQHDSNTVYDDRPDWRNDPDWQPSYSWHFANPGEGLGGESPWFGLLI